jgi:glycosyltransferase involved in cell wall biosynthesis
MKALVITPEPFFSPRGTPISVYYRTLVAAELGVEVDLLTYGQGQDVDIPGVRIYRIPRFSFLGAVKAGPSMLKLFLDTFLFLWAVGLLLRKRYRIVHAHEEAVLFCRLLKPVFGFKLVYDMHSSLPQQLANFNYTRSRLLIRLFERLEKHALARCDAAITICPWLADYARSRLKDACPLFLIENSIFEPIRLRGTPSASAPVVDLPQGRPIVMYAGSFESYQGLEILLPAFSRVLKQRPDAFLLMVGGRPDQVEQHQELAIRCGLESHCVFTGTLEKSITQRYQRRASVLVSPRQRGVNTPLKIYEQLASGIPLVATRIPAHTEVLGEGVCFLVDPDSESMAEGVIAALNDDERRARVVEGAVALYERNYSRAVYESKMRQLFESLG